MSLIGSLNHAAAVVRPGRVFLRRLIDLSKIPKELHHFVRLNHEARSDILWWKTFIGRWNGVGLLSALGCVKPSICLRSDASGQWGCGAVWQQEWLQLQWSPVLADLGIAAKEAIPVVLAAFCWGHRWSGRLVLFEVDNMTVASALRSGSCQDTQVMHLLRLLHFVAAERHFSYTSQHIPGSDNELADAISRNLMSRAFSVQPWLAADPALIPAGLNSLLLDSHLDWTSAIWRRQFLACLPRE